MIGIAMQDAAAAARVSAVALSRVKGVPKDAVDSVLLVRESGVQGDAHAGPGPRQVSLLAWPSIRRMEQRFGSPLGFGRFGENVVVDAPLDRVGVGDLIGLGRDAVLEVTAIGKECHRGCAIRLKTGDCIMPREGVFARVVASGPVTAGDPARFLRRSTDLAVVVLAGGRSRRFGSDKRFARLADGRTCLERAVQTAREVSTNVIVSVAHDESGLSVPGARVVSDETPDAGPLGGLVTSLGVCEAPIVLAFAVDQVGVTADLLRVLAVRTTGPGACLEDAKTVHPLPCALDRARVFARLAGALQAGRLALHEVLDDAGVSRLPVESIAELGAACSLLANWNTPADADGTFRAIPPAR